MVNVLSPDRSRSLHCGTFVRKAEGAPAHASVQISRVTASAVTCDETFFSRGAQRDAWVLFYVEAGALTAKVGEEDHLVESGNIMLYAPGESHAVSACNGAVSLLSLSFVCNASRLRMRKGRAIPAPPDAQAGLQKILWVLTQCAKACDYKKAMEHIFIQVVNEFCLEQSLCGQTG